jgi:hypothetical protein
LPEIQKFCLLLQHFSENSFIVSQLLSLCLLLDFGDEAGRRELSQWLANRLEVIVDEKEIVQILDVLVKIHDNDEVR